MVSRRAEKEKSMACACEIAARDPQSCAMRWGWPLTAGPQGSTQTAQLANSSYPKNDPWLLEDLKT